MSQCILHVGMRKTGSSSIQATLEKHLDPEKYALMLAPRANVSDALRIAFEDPEKSAMRKMAIPSRDTVDHFRKRKQSALNHFKSFFADNADRSVIVSAEGFENLDLSEVRDLLSLVPHDDITIICYIRAPHSAMESLLQQRIKTGGTSFSDASSLIPHYRRILKKYQELPAKFQPVYFDRASLINGCAVQDFFHRVGLDVAPTDVQNTNESITYEALSLIFAMNRWRVANNRRPAEWRKVRKWIRGFGGRKLSIHPDLYQSASALRQEDILWAEKLLGVEFPSRQAREQDMTSLNELTEVCDEAVAWLRDKVGGDFADLGHAASESFERFLALDNKRRRSESRQIA